MNNKNCYIFFCFTDVGLNFFQELISFMFLTIFRTTLHHTLKLFTTYPLVRVYEGWGEVELVVVESGEDGLIFVGWST